MGKEDMQNKFIYFLQFSWAMLRLLYLWLEFNIAGILEEEYYWGRANVWENLNKYKKSIHNLSKLLANHDTSYLRAKLGWDYLNLGFFEEAISNYKIACDKKKEIKYLGGLAYSYYHNKNYYESKLIANEIRQSPNLTNVDVEELTKLEELLKNVQPVKNLNTQKSES